MRLYLIFHLLFTLTFSNEVKCQALMHVANWQDEFTIIAHLPSNINNLVGQIDYLKQWDSINHCYQSYIPNGLAYPKAANQVVHINHRLTKYKLSDYFQQGWATFSAEKMDSILAVNKTIESCELNYDSLGRLVLSNRKKKENSTKEKTTVSISYLNNEQIDISILNTKFQFFAHYHSAENGHIRGRPLRQKSLWKLTYHFNKAGQLVEAISHFNQKTNGKKSRSNNQYMYTMEYDQLGRLTNKMYTAVGDSAVKNTQSTYNSTSFDYDEAVKLYPLLKVPSIKRWLNTLNANELTLVKSRINGSFHTTLMLNEHLPLLELTEVEKQLQIIWQYQKDSIFDYREKYLIAKIPDLNDTVKYNPNPKSSEIIIKNDVHNDFYQIPKGMIEIYSGDIYRKSTISLKNGWKMVKYQRGSDVNTRFAIGHRPPIRYDTLYDEFIFLDHGNRVRYYATYKHLYEFTYTEK
jgi:hypothetical protein